MKYLKMQGYMILTDSAKGFVYMTAGTPDSTILRTWFWKVLSTQSSHTSYLEL